MSKMGNLYLTIQEMLDNDYRPVTIAALLEIPVGWVYEVLYQDSPQPEAVDENVLEEMARFYGEA
jgi:hypothetical protein